MRLAEPQLAHWPTIKAEGSAPHADSHRADALLTRLSLERVAGRVPVIVTISHFATPIAVERARFAKDLGADIVMMMPPFNGP